MNVNDLINKMQVEKEGSVKTASAKQAKEKQAPKSTSKTASTANVDVVSGLMKMAEQLVGAEKEAEMAHASLCGQAFADAAITKFASFDAQVKIAAAQEAQELLAMEQQKTASYGYAGGLDQIDELVKAAAAVGYNEAVNALQGSIKQASTGDEAIDTFNMVKQAAYESGIEDVFAERVKEAAVQLGYTDAANELAKTAGYDAGLQEIHDLAAQEFLKGAAEAEIIINQKVHAK